MFYYIEGVVSIPEANTAVIDCGGVGYELCVSANTMSHLQQGAKARLYTYCSIKEDAFDLFGFFDKNEKRCFQLLISVSGVGPKAAVSILSCATPEALAMAIIDGDERMLTSAPGIGKKIAQRIILELKDKVSKQLGQLPSGASPAMGMSAEGARQNTAVQGLLVLGYTQAEISAALRKFDGENMTAEEIIRQVLKDGL